jgi:alanyl aminopeptidase
MILQPDFDLREANSLLLGPAGLPATRDLPFAFVKDHYDAIADKVPAGSTFGLGASLPYVGSGFCDEKGADALAAFFDAKQERFPGTRRNLAQVLESIHICAAYKTAQQGSVAEFLRQY